ncbi:MAG: hypothetical protein QOG01_2342 [Pseudonocardiales bacterium]|jgi:hypothetical protein|nr:hypothetical protein [Pseudonocardiales bacterium]
MSVTPPGPATADQSPLSSPDAELASDFHLVESVDGWVLTINVTERLRQALAAQDADASPAPQTADFTVHVEPNLLPGEPFPATLALLHPTPTPKDVEGPDDPASEADGANQDPV